MLLYEVHIDEDSSYPLHVAYYRVPPRPAKPSYHWHYHLEISCVMSGKGEYYIEGNMYEMRTDDIFIFNSQERHGLGVHDPHDMFILVISFDPRFIWSLESCLFDARYLTIFYGRNLGEGNRLNRQTAAAKAIVQLFRDIHEEAQSKGPEYRLMIKTKLLALLVELLRHFGPSYPPRAEDHRRSQGLAFINNVIKYMDEHLVDEIRLEDLAQISHMNSSYFSTFFKKYMGLSPIEFLTQRRIQRAVEYLRATERTILDIAHRCGFNNTSSFNKAFKKMTGKTPSEFRRP